MSEKRKTSLGSLLFQVTTRTGAHKERGVPYIGLENIPSGGSKIGSYGRAEDSISSNNIFESGDILFGKLRPRLRKSVRAQFRGYCSTDVLVLRVAEDVHPGFAGYVAQSDTVFSAAIRTEEGTKMPRCSWKDIQLVEVFCPVDNKEQAKIASVLASLDLVIEKTEALIEKYQQIKAGLMHDLFTRGVLPDGKLRPTQEQAPELYRETGIGWIPKEWGIQKVEDCGEVKLGRQRSPDQHSGKWTTPYLRVANVLDGVIDYSDVLEMDFTPTERKLFELHPGDILLNEGQSLELVGRSAIYRGEPGQFCFQNTLVRFRCTPENHASFFAHLFKLWLDRGAFQIISKQTTSVAHLGADRFAKMVCPKVGLHEQKIIAQRLNSAEERIAKTEAHRENLAHQKAGLMHDLLTGKVAVKVDATEEEASA
jgi:type I restriction enzyme S subunit